MRLSLDLMRVLYVIESKLSARGYADTTASSESCSGSAWNVP